MPGGTEHLVGMGDTETVVAAEFHVLMVSMAQGKVETCTGVNLEQLWREQIRGSALSSQFGVVLMCALNPHQGPSGQLLQLLGCP